MSESVVAIRLRALGDVVLTTPALRALKRGHAEAELEVVTESRYAPLLEGHPDVARVWPLERDAGSTIALLVALRRRRVRLAVDFFGNPRSALIAAACGARTTAGYDLRGRGRAYRLRVPRELRPAPGRREAAAATHVRLALAAGGVHDGLETSIAIGAAARDEGATLLARAGVASPERTLGFIVAGTWATKAWPVSHAADCVRRLLASGQDVLLLSGPGEERVVARMRAIVPGVRVLPPCGVATLAAAVGRLRAVVGTDSGPRHLAAAQGVPTFAWFGPTHPDTWNPPGEAHGFWRTDLPCRACDRTSCPHWNCLPSLAPQHAATLVLEHLERHGRPASDLGPAARA